MEQKIATHDVRISQLEKAVEENRKIITSIHEIRADMKHLTNSWREFIDTSNSRATRQGERIGTLEGQYSALSPVVSRNADRINDIDIRLKLAEGKDGKKFGMIVEKVVYIIGMIILAFLLNWLGV